jgi:hypothetical protein
MAPALEGANQQISTVPSFALVTLAPPGRIKRGAFRALRPWQHVPALRTRRLGAPERGPPRLATPPRTAALLGSMSSVGRPTPRRRSHTPRLSQPAAPPRPCFRRPIGPQTGSTSGAMSAVAAGAIPCRTTVHPKMNATRAVGISQGKGRSRGVGRLDLWGAAAVLIRVWIEGSQPLAGTTAIEGGKPRRFDRWLELLRVVSELVAAGTTDSRDSDTAERADGRNGGRVLGQILTNRVLNHNRTRGRSRRTWRPAGRGVSR